MTAFSDATLACSNASDALFRAWASFIYNSWVGTGGWLNTSDTGQINLATVTAPGAGSTSQGYKILKMNDALQATKPVFVKVEFGSSATGATSPAIWLTVGTGSDGAGNITGILLARFTHGSGSAAAAGPYKNFASVGTGRFVCAVFCDAAINNPWMFSIERTVDTSGTDNSDGVVVSYGRGTNLWVSAWIPFTGAAPPQQSGYHGVLAAESPSSYNIDIGVSLVIPMAGRAKAPPLNQLMCRAGDFTNFATITLNVYGSSHTYQHIGSGMTSMRNNGANGLSDTNCRLAIRYE